jgi:biopolymer transport protein ExbB
LVLEQGMLSFALLGAGWVLWLLVFMSIACIAISLERAAYMWREGTDAASLQQAVDGYLAGGDTETLGKHLAALDGMEARVLTAGVELSPKGSEAAERAMLGVMTAEKMAMVRGLSVLATVGANAPFIGLFGTVLGIIRAFHELSVNTAEASEAVMGGISEALVATAVGLLVAIPAVVLYNGFTRWVKSRMARSESLSQLVLARINGEAHGK